MSKLVILLSISGSVLAGSTVYLANELREERARSKASISNVIVAPPSRAVATGLPVVEARSAEPVKSSTSAPSQAEDESADPEFYDFEDEAEEEDAAARIARRKARMEKMGRDFLRRYDDPKEREKLIAETKAERSRAFRERQIPGLSDAELADLEDLRTRQLLASRADSYRCTLTPGCNYTERYRTSEHDQRLEIAALLGPEKFRQYDTYVSTSVERGVVAQLRLRLDDANALSEADGERLIKVLSEERQKYQRDAEANGASIFVLHTPEGVFIGQNASVAGSDEFRRDIDSGIEFSKRLRKRASEVLSASQQRVFERMQEDLVVTMREHRREQELRFRRYQ